MDHDATYQVGHDITPGLWHTDGPRAPNVPCHWEEKAFKTPSEITINAADVIGAFAITINPTDDGFVTSGCQTWHFVRPD